MRSNLIKLTLMVTLLMCGSWLKAEDSAGGSATTVHLSDATIQLASLNSLTDDDTPQPDAAAVAPAASSAYDTPIWMNNTCLECEAVPADSWLAVRFGGWGVITSGSKAKVGEWDGLQDWSPFYDVDGLTSDGHRTADFFVTGTEGRSTMAGLDFYNGPGLQAELGYRRFLHRLGVDPIGGPALPSGFAPEGGNYNPPLPNGDPGYVLYGSGDAVTSDLVNAGDKYAIRVQQFDASLKGRINDTFKWRVNFWGMKKEGTRQASSQAHCFPDTPAPGGNTCHLVSQGQRIDWLTMEVEPVIEANFGWLTVEYSRTMRTFDQDDQIVTNAFTRTSRYGWGAAGANAAYGYVPENTTEIDRMKIHADLTCNTDLYVLGHVGNTHNNFRESDRKFYGVDARITNRSIDGLNLTAYGKSFTQNNSPDTESLNNRYPGQASQWLEQVQDTGVPISPQDFYASPPINEPWYLGVADRDWLTFGTKARWRPFQYDGGLRSQLAVVGGYEWKQISRTNVTYDLVNLPGGPDGLIFTQPTTVANSFFAGVEQDWTRRFRSYLRYRFTDTSWPLVGVTHREQLSLDAAVNSNQPERENRIELGSTWNVADDFMISGSFWIQNSSNHSDLVNFSENNYPLTLTAWYAPSDCWSFSAGYANLTNWIDQDITLGREDGIGGFGGPELTAFTSPWSYKGRSDVVTLAANYAASQRLRYTGRVEYVSSENYFNTPPAPAGAIPYVDMPGYSAVATEIWRLTAGVDYLVRDNVNVYFRYNLFNYDDFNMAFNTGTAHMFLGGLTATF